MYTRGEGLASTFCRHWVALANPVTQAPILRKNCSGDEMVCRIPGGRGSSRRKKKSKALKEKSSGLVGIYHTLGVSY